MHTRLIKGVFELEREKAKYEKYGIPTDGLYACDIYGGFVPTDLSQKAKTDSFNVDETAEINLERFGL